MEPVLVVAGIIVKDKKVLLTRRAPKEDFAGGWEFPGGKVEEGETEKEALARELKEELNIDVIVEELCKEVFHDYKTIKIQLKAYYCTLSGGDIEISVHDSYKWVNLEQLLSYRLLPADIAIAEKIMKENKSKYFK